MAKQSAPFWHIETRLIHFKAFFFFYTGSINAVSQFMVLYYKQLGLSPRQIGLISGVRPIFGSISAPLIGSLADRYRVRRYSLMTTVIGFATFTTLMGFITPAAVEQKCPAELLSVNVSSLPIERQKQFDNYFKNRGWMFEGGDLQRIFYTLISLANLAEIFRTPTGTVLDAGVLEELGPEEMHKYGQQRAWGAIGPAIISILSGAVVNLTRNKTSLCGFPFVSINYRPAFIIFACGMVLCFISSTFFNFKKQKEEKTSDIEKPNPLQVFKMFLSIHYGSWILCIYFMGMCNGVIWGFLFWHLENLGATQFMLGTASSVCLWAEVFVFYTIHILLRRFRHSSLMMINLAGYVIRFFAFATIENPWYVLPTEILQGMTYAGCWIVVTDYFCSNIPNQYLATVQGILHGVYWGVGTASGNMIGGVLVERIGASNTFWIFSVAAFFNMLLFYFSQKVNKKPSPVTNESDYSVVPHS